jgi:O-antigen ligase
MYPQQLEYPDAQTGGSCEEPQVVVGALLRDRITPALLCIWWILHLALVFVRKTDERIDAVANGSWLTETEVLLFASIGAIHLRRATRALFRRRNAAIVLLFLFYIAWSVSSLLWTDQAALTLRRLGVLALVWIGCVGLGAGYYGVRPDGMKLYIKHVIAGGLVAAALLIGHSAEELSTARWFDPTWVTPNRGTFSEFTAANAYAGVALVYYCYCWRRPWRLLCLGFPLLTAFLLTKSRSVGAFTAIAVLLLAFFMRKGRSRASVTLGVVGGGLVLALMLSSGPYWNGEGPAATALAVFDSAIPVFQGEGYGVLSSLNGRVPLWNVILQYSAIHPWCGYGYGAFWSANRLLDIGNRAGWLAPSAHYGLLDEALGTGYIGLILILMAWIASMKRSLSLLVRDRLHAAALVFCLFYLTLLYNFSTSIFQFYFSIPFLIPLIGLFALLETSASLKKSG